MTRRPVIAASIATIVAPLAAVFLAPPFAPRFVAIVAGTAIAADLAAIVLIVVAIVTVIGVAGISGGIVIERITATLPPVVGCFLAIVAKDTIIMIGILQIIFGSDAVARLLGITRQGAVFFKQLAGVAALTIVEAVAVIVAAIHLLWARAAVVTAAAASPVLIVSDQRGVPV